MPFSKKAGGCLILVGLPFLLLAVFMVATPKPGQKPMESLAPGLFFGSVALVPGAILFVAGSRAQKEREFLDGVAGLIRSHDSFQIGEMAIKIGRTELETEAIVHRIDFHAKDIELVFHRPTRSYMHRARMQRGSLLVERCPACGAPTGLQVVFAGESGVCTFCGAGVPVRQG